MNALCDCQLNSLDSAILAFLEQDTLPGGGDAQNIVSAIHAAVGRMINTDTQAWKSIGVQVMNNVFQPIMPGSTALCTQAYFTDGQIELIVDHQHIFGLDFVPAYQF